MLLGFDKYFQVARLIDNSISILPSTPDVNIQRLFKTIKESDLNLNYDKASEAFTKQYWQRNYWKAVYFFEYEFKSIALDLNRKQGLQILVLGAGSAADTIACMVWLNKTAQTKKKITFTLVDKSQKQLDMACRFVKKIMPEMNKINLDVRYQVTDINDWNPVPNSADLILMSHFLTENHQELKPLLEKIKLVAREQAQIAVIERQRDDIWRLTRDKFMNMGIPVFDTKTYKKDLANLFRSLEDDKSELLSITPHYVLAKLPEDKYQLDIIAKFFYAWKGQSIDTVMEIFSKNAKYYEKPMIDPPVRGLDAIKGYWEVNPILQKNIQVKAKRVSYESRYIMCEFGGDFDTPKQHIDIQGSLVFDIDPRTRQIREMREYFNTVKTPFGMVR